MCLRQGGNIRGEPFPYGFDACRPYFCSPFEANLKAVYELEEVRGVHQVVEP